MPGDNRPDPRFAMIALELTTEIETPSPTAPDPDPGELRASTATVGLNQRATFSWVDNPPAPRRPPPQLVRQPLVESAEGLTTTEIILCPRCGTGAFEGGVVAGRPSVSCMGCPLPAPIYQLPDGLTLTTNRYRCEACGKEVRVTMTLSEVNLHCGGCGRLGIHSRMDGPSRSFPDERPLRKPEEARRRLTPAARRQLDDAVTRAVNAARGALPRAARPSVVVDGVNDVEIARDDPMMRELTRAMTSILVLEDFDAYADRRRNENSNTCGACGLSRDEHAERVGRSCEAFAVMPDVERATGRTTRGVVELLARHYLATTNPTVWVLGGSEQADSWLRSTVFDLRNRLGRDHPSRVGVVPNVMELEERGLRPPAGVMLYIDHTYYERGRGRARRDVVLTYRPD